MNTRRLPLAISIAAIATFAATAPAAGSVDLRVDANRDGRVTVADNASEHIATPMRGGLMLPNLDDDSGRCRATYAAVARRTDALLRTEQIVRVLYARGRVLDRRLDGCNDARDARVNGAADVQDLAPLVVAPSAPASGGGALLAQGRGRGRVRVFIRDAGRYVPFRGRLTSAQMRRGVVLGIEATDIVRDARRWDGTVRLTLISAGSSDSVVLRVAPLLTHDHTQAARRLVISPSGEKNANTALLAEETAATRAALNAKLRAAAARTTAWFAAAQRRHPLAEGVTVLDAGDPWAQDYFEPMYASMPGPGGRPHVIRLMLRSDQDRPAQRYLYRMAGRDLGVVRMGGTVNDSTLDSMGNLETIPPYRHAGRNHPAGRIVMGRMGQQTLPSPRVLRMLRAQGMQTPLLVDTGWLAVGHVDEFMQFVPAPGTARGWKVIVADPDGAMALLERVNAAGGGAQPVMRHPEYAPGAALSGGAGRRNTAAPGADGPEPRASMPEDMTVAEAVASARLRERNRFAARRIAASLTLLKRSVGITDADVIRVPTLFRSEDPRTPEDLRREMLQVLSEPGFARLPAAQQTTTRSRYRQALRLLESGKLPQPGLVSFIPGPVNSIVWSATRVVGPTQFGPRIGGVDVFAEAVRARYAAAGMSVEDIDDVVIYHNGDGEIHCGSNTLRDASRRWWAPVAAH